MRGGDLPPVVGAEPLTEAEVLDVARASEAVVYAVGVTPRTNTSWSNSGRWRRRTDGRADHFLETITGGTGGRAEYTESMAELEDVFLSVLAEMKTRYLLSFQVQGALQEGWHKLEVRLANGRRETIRARGGYMVVADRN